MSASQPAVVTLDLATSCLQVERDEGYRQFPYRDSRDVLTVGIGFNLDDVGLSLDESHLVLQHRLWTLYLELIKALPWVKTLDEARQGVLLNMAYNLGVVGELKFHITLTDVQVGLYELAADAMLESTWAKEVGPRAHRLAEQMRSGVWQ